MSPPRETRSQPVHSRKRKHSEISGLDADKPVKKRTRTRTRHAAGEEETSLWTTVRRYLGDPASHPQPSVSCPVCAVPIAIRGVPMLEPCPWRVAHGSQQVGVVLPCAHILCQECTDGHMAAQGELDPAGQRSCPCCRAGLLFPGCLHTVPPQRLPLATGEDASAVPLTMPELQPGVSRLPEDCWECTARASEEYVDISMRFVSEILHGVGYPPGQGPRGWDDAVEASKQLVRDYLGHQRALPSWRNGSVRAGPLRVCFAGEAADLLLGVDLPDGDAVLYSPEGQAFWYVPVHQGDGTRAITK